MLPPRLDEGSRHGKYGYIFAERSCAESFFASQFLEFCFGTLGALGILGAFAAAGFMLHYARTRSSYWNEPVQSCGDLTRECRKVPVYAWFSGVVTFGNFFLIALFPLWALLIFAWLGMQVYGTSRRALVLTLLNLDPSAAMEEVS